MLGHRNATLHLPRTPGIIDLASLETAGKRKNRFPKQRLILQLVTVSSIPLAISLPSLDNRSTQLYSCVVDTRFPTRR